MKKGKTASAYIIRNLSPLHVGAGDANYGVIDKQVQRDSVSGLPVIHSSSLKGALREFFDYRLQRNSTEERCADLVETIFGHPKGDDTKKFKAGLFDFDFGFLLSMPVRTDRVAYMSVTTVDILDEFLERLKLFDIAEEQQNAIEKLVEIVTYLKENLHFKTQKDVEGTKEKERLAFTFEPNMEGAILEEEDYRTYFQDMEITQFKALEQLIGKNPVVMENTAFRKLSESLPVIARNKLENGESKNLWYEEIVPRESRFYTIITKAVKWAGSEQDFSYAECFDSHVVENKKLIQIGANATIGYGKTQFTKLNTKLS